MPDFGDGTDLKRVPDPVHEAVTLQDYRHRYATYRTDPDKLRAAVPEPLEITEPHVKYEFIRMPDSMGFGDYTDGFVPANAMGANGAVRVDGCVVADDYSHALGDVNEGELSVALSWLQNGTSACPAPTASGPSPTLHETPRMRKPVWLMNRILANPRR